LTRQLLDRDNKFGDAVAKLEKVVIGIQPVIETLRQAAHHSETAADRLAERSQSIADSLQNTIGTKSPAYKAISSFGSVFERSEEAIQKLTGLVERVGKSLHHLPEDLQASSQASLAGALDQLGRIIKDKEDGARKFRDPANTPYQEHSSPAGAAFAQRDGKAPGNPNRTPAATHGGTDLAAAIQAFSGQHKQDPAAPAKSRDALLAEALARAGSANAATPELTEYSPLDPPRGYDRSSG
jgi:ABC-type transporter Mla subunit MlaD